MYNVQVEYIAIQIGDEIKERILTFLQAYEFPYIKSLNDKSELKKIFIEHFTQRATLKSLIKKLDDQLQKENIRNISAREIALLETNRLHTRGLGDLLLSKGMEKCTTENSYGTRPMHKNCWNNLENPPEVINNITVKGKPKILNIKEILKNSFPLTYEETKRTDVPMIPQTVNCYHIIVPIE